jgi:AcrR family transcriptional regulator
MTPAVPPRRGPGRPRGAVIGATRDSVLDVAARLFGSTGYRGTSLADVAQAAGLSNAGLLHHFPSKEQLLVEVLRRRDLRDSMEFMFAAPQAISIWDSLEAMVGLARANSQRPGLVKLYSTVAGEATDDSHPAHGWLREHLGVAVGNLTAAFEAGKAAGTVRRDAPSASLARQCVAVLDGLQIQWLAFGNQDGGADGLVGAATPVEMSSDVRVFVDGLRSQWRLAGPRRAGTVGQ